MHLKLHLVHCVKNSDADKTIKRVIALMIHESVRNFIQLGFPEHFLRNPYLSIRIRTQRRKPIPIINYHRDREAGKRFPVSVF